MAALSAVTRVAVSPVDGTIVLAGQHSSALRVVALKPDGAGASRSAAPQPAFQVDLAPDQTTVEDMRVSRSGEVWILFRSRAPGVDAPETSVAKIARTGAVAFVRALGADVGKHEDFHEAKVRPLRRTGTLAESPTGMWIAIGPDSDSRHLLEGLMPTDLLHMSAKGDITTELPVSALSRGSLSTYPGSTIPLIVTSPQTSDLFFAQGHSWSPDHWTILVQRVAPNGAPRWSDRLDLRRDYFQYAVGMTSLGDGDILLGISPHIWTEGHSAVVRLKK